MRIHQNLPRQTFHVDFRRFRISKNHQIHIVFVGFPRARTSVLLDLASQILYVDFPARPSLRLLTVWESDKQLKRT